MAQDCAKVSMFRGSCIHATRCIETSSIRIQVELTVGICENLCSAADLIRTQVGLMLAKFICFLCCVAVIAEALVLGYCGTHTS